MPLVPLNAGLVPVVCNLAVPLYVGRVAGARVPWYLLLVAVGLMYDAVAVGLGADTGAFRCASDDAVGASSRLDVVL